MSIERIINSLEHLGLSRSEAEVYVYIANKGPQKAMNIVEALNISKSIIYSCLKNLETKELVTKKYALLTALPFEEALELLIEREKKQTNHIQESKEELLANWKKEE